MLQRGKTPSLPLDFTKVYFCSFKITNMSGEVLFPNSINSFIIKIRTSFTQVFCGPNYHLFSGDNPSESRSLYTSYRCSWSQCWTIFTNFFEKSIRFGSSTKIMSHLSYYKIKNLKFLKRACFSVVKLIKIN